MENEVKQEVKVETKKKGNGLFTVFACVMTGAIVFMATNLGEKASKVVDPDTNGGNTTTSNVESNVTSNVESNVTSNVVSNTTSNVVSNTTSNVATTTKYTGTYKGTVLLNSQNNEYIIYTLAFDANNKVSLAYGMISNDGGSGAAGYSGTYEVKNNKLVMNATEELTTIGSQKMSSAKTIEFAINTDGTFTYIHNGKSVVFSQGKVYNGKYSGTVKTADGNYEYVVELNSTAGTAKYSMSIPKSEGITYSGTFNAYNDGILFMGDKAYRSAGEVEETNIIYFKANADGTLTFTANGANVTLKK